ncbi:uncharacterized protein LOC120348336 [Styela clava]
MEVLTILSALCFTALVVAKPTTKECQLPALKEVDSNMLTGTWYLVLTPVQPFEEMMPCFAAKNVRDSGKGTYVRGMIIYPSKDTVEIEDIPLHYFAMNHTSINYMDPKYEFIFADSAKRHGIGEEGMKEVKGVFSLGASQVTDYENYLIWVECAFNGDKYALAYTRTNHPSAENILQIHNALAEIGGEWSQIPLHLAGCTKFDIPFAEI